MNDAVPHSSLLEVADLVPPRGSDQTARSRRLSLGMLAVYGAGGLSEHVIAFALSSLLLFYLTIVCGLSGTAAGFTIGLAMVVDAFVQPLVGSLSDNSHSRHGRRHPFMLAGAVPLLLGFGLLYSVPASLTGGCLFAYVLVLLVAIRAAHAVFNTPYVALGAEISDDYNERSWIVIARILLGSLGGLLATWLAYGVFMKGHDGQTHRAVYAPFAWSCCLIAAVGIGISMIGTLRVRDRLHTATVNQSFSFGRFFTEIGELVRNRSFRALFLTALANQIAWGAASALGLHANTYFWKLTTKQILSVNVLGVSGYLAGCLIAAALTKVLQKRTICFLGLICIASCQIGLVPLRLAGIITDDHALMAVTIAALVSQAGMSLTLIGFQSMTADAADEHEHLFGSRREGLFYAGSSVAAFASNGIGAMIGGIGLDLIGFPHGLGKAAAHVAIPTETVRSLGLLYGPGAGLVTLLAIVSLLGYRLGRKEHGVIRDALVKRRREAAIGD